MPYATILKYGIPILLILAVLSGGYFAVQTYSKTLKENQTLTERVKVAEATNKALTEQHRAIIDAIDANDRETKSINTHTETIKREIREIPVTKECLESPAIGVVMRSLREEQPSAKPTNP